MTVRARIVLACGVVGLATLSLSPAQAKNVPQDRVFELGERNVVSGSATALAHVNLPAPARISAAIGSNPDFRVSGEGFGGFLLMEDRPLGKGALLFGGRLPMVGAFVPRDDRGEFLLPFHKLEFPEDESQDYVLPSGDYLLYLISDGSFVEVTLYLRGLAGTTTLDPHGRVDSTFKWLQPRIESDPARVVYSAGDVSRLTSEGLIFFSLVTRHQNQVVAEYGSCTYEGPPQNPDPVGWLPHCPVTEGFAWVTTIQGAGFMGFYQATVGLWPGEWTVVGWYETVALVERADAIALWLSL